MVLSNELTKKLNGQVDLESNASQFYLEIANWCDHTGYEGAASYFYAQSEEERGHMLKIIRFMNNLGVQPTLHGSSQANVKVEDLEGALKQSLQNERRVTAAINDMLKYVNENGEYAALELLQWFATEQVEEETKFANLLQRLKIYGHNGVALLEFDRHLAEQSGK